MRDRLGVCTNSTPILIITELMPHGALLDFMRKEVNRPNINLTVMIDMLAQIWFFFVFYVLSILSSLAIFCTFLVLFQKFLSFFLCSEGMEYLENQNYIHRDLRAAKYAFPGFCLIQSR